MSGLECNAADVFHFLEFTLVEYDEIKWVFAVRTILRNRKIGRRGIPLVRDDDNQVDIREFIGSAADIRANKKNIYWIDDRFDVRH